ncbi:MAG: adenylate kinase [Gemmatimonadetes bacterium]|nr:adenylate kinase [Gemmatimonadota bacterium]
MVVILLGPPGVGKGTQGRLLVGALGWERLVTGELLREARRQGTELGKKAQAYMDAGDLVPDDVIVALVKEWLAGIPGEIGVVFDGFPRTAPQADALSRSLPEVGRSVDGVVVLEAPDDVLVKRIAGRRSCARCGRAYNVHYDPPQREETCDACGVLLDQRKDDTPATVRHRLDVYREMTEPLIAYYESGLAPVLRVDGNRPQEVVREAVWQTLVEELEVG